MNYHFEEHALQELRDAIAYYEAVDLELGNRFRAAVLNAISLIRQFPERVAAALSFDTPLSGKAIPYGIIYRIKNDQIEIVAIAHFSREPNYWVDRL